MSDEPRYWVLDGPDQMPHMHALVDEVEGGIVGYFLSYEYVTKLAAYLNGTMKEATR